MRSRRCHDHDPDWSPDGRSVAFIRAPRGNQSAGLWIMDADGANERQIVDQPNDESSPRWSPHGRSIAFTSQREQFGRYDVYIVSRDGSNDTGADCAVADTVGPLLTRVVVPQRARRRHAFRVRFTLSEGARYARGASRTRPLPAGAQTVTMPGVRAGTYRVAIRATDASGNPSAPVRGTLRVG